MDYKKAGVDIDAADAAVERIKGLAKSTFRPEVLHGPGGFGGMFAPGLQKMKEPVLVSSTDGVGTKLKIAFAVERHDTIGIDCVAMCVNDILVQGAEPLFFLDYLAVGKLKPEQVEEIVTGVAEGCRDGGCALLGGETAEMPGFYPDGEYDLAGFAVGTVDREKIIDGSKIKKGDVVIGLASNGLHSNGFSLVRKALLEEAGLLLTDFQPGLGMTLAEELLRPTSIYVKPVLKALKKYSIRGMAHITGGGLPGNLPRVLPSGLQAEIDPNAWMEPPVFDLISELGEVRRSEMFRTFNMGIGYCLFVSPQQSDGLLEHFSDQHLTAYKIGRVESGNSGVVIKDL
ncbi:MAG: phosphoribosylformylglycinamidine cyclo-ligase [Bacillota bacterium]